MKIMNTKGISPLIATVLIIGFTVALAAVILTWGTSFTKSISKSTEETADIQLTCAQDVQFDVKAACMEGNNVRVIVENNGNKDIKNFTARFKLGETDVLSAETLSGIARFGIKTYVAMPGDNDPLTAPAPTVWEVDGFDAVVPTEILEVTLVPVISMAGKDVTCPNSIDSYAPAVEGTFLGPC